MSNIDRRTLVKGSLAAILAGAAVSRAAFAETSEPILLGVSGPLTGPNAQYGAQWKQGFDLALEENAADGLLIVEWPEVAMSALPEEHLLLRFETVDFKTRRIHLEPHGARYEALAADYGKPAELRPRVGG